MHYEDKYQVVIWVPQIRSEGENAAAAVSVSHSELAGYSATALRRTWFRC